MPIPADPLDVEQQENLVVNVSKLNPDVYSIIKGNTTDQDYYKQNDNNDAAENKSQKKLWIPRWNRKYALYLIIVLLLVAFVVVLTLLFTNKPSATVSFASTVNTGWTSWGHWSRCTQSCGPGVQIRSRSCLNSVCSGDSSEITACTIKACQEAGWSGWSDWGSCSVTCGLGLKRRHRTCNNPEPSPFGSYCNGSSEEVNMCSQPSCYAVGWSPWGQWSPCTESCGGGIQFRSRSCLYPISSSGQPACTGDHTEITKCNSVSCPNEISDVKYPLYKQNGILGFDDQHLDRKINNAVKSSTGSVVYYSIPLLSLACSVAYLLLRNGKTCHSTVYINLCKLK